MSVWLVRMVHARIRIGIGVITSHHNVTSELIAMRYITYILTAVQTRTTMFDNYKMLLT